MANGPHRFVKLPIRLSTAPARRLGLLTPRLTAEGIEAAIRKRLKKPTGELTKADLEKVNSLDIRSNQLTDGTGLENLTQLTKLGLGRNRLTDVTVLKELTQLVELNLGGNPSLTKAQIAELQKPLPKCNIDY